MAKLVDPSRPSTRVYRPRDLRGLASTAVYRRQPRSTGLAVNWAVTVTSGVYSPIRELSAR